MRSQIYFFSKASNIYHILLLFFFYSSVIYSQNTESDLRKQLKTAKDTLLINTYLDLGKYYFSTTGKPDSLISFGEKALKLSKKLKNSDKQINSLKYIGSGYIVLEEYPKAEKFLKEGLSLAAKIKDIKSQANLCNKLGTLYQNKGEYLNAIEYLLKAAKYSEVISDYDNSAKAYYGVSMIYAMQDQQNKQFNYINKALQLVKANKEVTQDTKNIVYNFASQQYLELYLKSKKEVDGDLAITYAKQSLAIANQNNFTPRKPSSFSVLSRYYLGKKEYIKAQNFANQVLKYKEFINEPTRVNAFFVLGEVCMHSNKKVQAYNYIDSLKVLKIKEEPYYGAAISKFSFTVYKYFKDYDLAFKSLEEKEKYDEELKKLDQNKAVNELETKYQTAIKEAKIISLNQQKKIDELNIENKQSQIKWLLVLVIGAILSIILIWLYARQRALKSEQKIMQTEQRLNRARINPHFFFNAMASLQNLSQHEKSIQTTLFISRFAKIMRQSLENTYEELITIEEELDFLTQYLEIQKLRYPNKFDYEFHVADSLEINELKIPGMIIQPFVENSIEHGFKAIDYLGKIDITIVENENQITIEIEDNGKGVNLVAKEKEYKSRAMQIIQDRLYLFNKQHKVTAHYKIETPKNNSGFKIVVYLPKMFQ